MMSDPPRGLERVERAMRRVASDGSLGASLAHHLGSGGKRLRAVMALRAGDAFGVAPSEAIEWATACELLHNATLVHDDLCDRDPQRRGRTSVWAGWGDTVALCLGDLLLTEAFAAADRIAADGARRRLRGLLRETVRRLTEGQAMEVDAAAQGVPDAAFCLRVTEAKTVPLVTLPIAGVLALAGRAEPACERALAAFAGLGRAYQMLDDLEDVLGPGQDLHRRVPNHAVAAFLDAASPPDRATLQWDWRDRGAPWRAERWLIQVRSSAAPRLALDRAQTAMDEAAVEADAAPPALLPVFRLLSDHLNGQVEGLRRRVAETGAAAAPAAA